MLAKKACDNGMNEAEYIRLLISQKPNDYPEVRKILKNSSMRSTESALTSIR